MAVNAKFVQEGAQINYTPAAAVLAGAIVLLGDLVGVARAPIAAGETGALAIEGVFRVIKSGSTGPVFAVGDMVLWDIANGLAVRSGVGGGYVPLGTCLEAAGASDTSVVCELLPHALPACMQGKTWEDVDISGGSKTLALQDVGKVMNVLVGHATNVVTLPAITAGSAHFVVRCGATGQRVAVSPNASDKLLGPDLTGTDNKDRILAAATSRQGDYLFLDYGTADGYCILGERGIWAQEA